MNGVMGEVWQRIIPCSWRVCCFTVYCIGITSSRKIEQATYDNVAFRYLSADQHPDHDTLAAFRQEHVKAGRVICTSPETMSESWLGEVG